LFVALVLLHAAYDAALPDLKDNLHALRRTKLSRIGRICRPMKMKVRMFSAKATLCPDGVRRDPYPSRHLPGDADDNDGTEGEVFLAVELAGC